MSKKEKKEARYALSYHSVKDFYKFIEDLIDDDIILVKMKCSLNSYDCGSFFKAELAAPIFNDEGGVEDYNHGSIEMVWNKNGKLIKNKSRIPTAE